MSDLSIIVTNAGRAALVNAQNNGTNPVLIASVGVSPTAIAASPTTTAIAGELKRVGTIAGEVVADDTMHLVVRDESTDIYTLRSFGLYLGDGTLFAVYSQAAPILEKSTQSMLLLALDVRFADINAVDLTFGDANFLNPPATTDIQGVVELATDAEAETGTDATRAVTPRAMKSAVTNWLNARLGAGAPSAFVKGLLTAASAAAMRIALGLGSAATRNEGAGGGLDSDLLDGKEGAWYADILARLGFTPWGPHNDGAGSGMDADTVDGRQASEFALLTGAAFTGGISATTGGFSGTVTIGGGTKGRITVKEGDANNTGFVEFLTAAGARKGYVGFVGVENAVNYVAEGGVFHKFTGDVQMSSTANTIFSNNFGSLSSAEPTKFLNNADWIWQNTNGTVRLTLKGAGGLDVPAGAGYSIGNAAVVERSSDGSSIFAFCGTTYWRLMDSTKLVNMLIVNNGTGDLSARGNIASGGVFDTPAGTGGYSIGGVWALAKATNGSDVILRSGTSALIVRDANAAVTNLTINNATGDLIARGSITSGGALTVGGNIDIAAGSGIRIAGRVIATDAANGTWLYGGTAGFIFRNAANSATITTLDNVGNLSVVGAITRAGNKVWDAGNDGSGSGLDADTLDGLHATAFAKIADFAATGHSANGYQILPGGLILQWGRVSVSEDSYGTLTFPIAFTSACWSLLMGVATEVGNTTAQANGPMPYAVSITGASLYNAAPTASAWWIAIGK